MHISPNPNQSWPLLNAHTPLLSPQLYHAWNSGPIKNQFSIPTDSGKNHATLWLCGDSFSSSSYKRSIPYVFFCNRLYFAEHGVLEFQSCNICQNFLPFGLYLAGHPNLAYPFISQGVNGFLSHSAHCEQCCYVHRYTNISLSSCFQLSGIDMHMIVNLHHQLDRI